MSAAPEIKRIHPREICGGFDAGEGHESLTDFLRRFAKQNDRAGMSATHLAWLDESIAGFATSVPGTLVLSLLEGMVKGLTKHPAPVLALLSQTSS